MSQFTPVVGAPAEVGTGLDNWADLPSEVWVQPTGASSRVRDVTLELSLQGWCPKQDGDTEGYRSATHTDTVRLTAVEVDLGIARGGSDLDLGESKGGQPTQVLGEGEEEDPGAYLLVNWDNDDGADPPVPDLDKTSVTDEDNLARITIGVEPALPDAGTLSLSGAAGQSVRVWNSSTKGTEVTDFSWDLAQESPPQELWLEGVYATEEREVAIELTYAPPTAGGISDSVKATCVMVHLGNAVYREHAMWVQKGRGHAALVTGYTGECAAADLSDDSNFTLTEMDHLGENRTMDTMTQTDLVPFGCYGKPGITLSQRLKVLRTARAVDQREGGIGYCLNDALNPKPWNDTVPGIGELRCDGLAEVCYEINGIMVWGAIDGGAPGYDIRDDSFQEQHNNWDDVWWKDTLMPATQCGYEDTYRGVDWQTTFEQEDLCVPIGSTGGN